MPGIKDLRKRITSVKNTQQTTKAMKMVSAAKLRRAQDAIYNQKPYAKSIGETIMLAASLSEAPVKSPLIHRVIRRESGEGVKRKLFLVLVTSDRGLCGGFNGNVTKAAQRWVRANQSSYESIQLGFVGRRGYDFFKTQKDISLEYYYPEAGGKVVFAKAKKLSDTLLAVYLSGKFDEVKFIYNEFKNVMSQKVVVEDFLPLERTAEPLKDTIPASVDPGIYIVKPGLQAVLDQLLSKHFSTQTFRILLESQAGEHGARMSAMENATKNAGEMIKKLTLQYNKQRQAGITKELLEIIAGSESQKAS